MGPDGCAQARLSRAAKHEIFKDGSLKPRKPANSPTRETKGCRENPNPCLLLSSEFTHASFLGVVEQSGVQERAADFFLHRLRDSGAPHFLTPT